MNKIRLKGSTVINPTSSLVFNDASGIQYKVNAGTANSLVKIEQDFREEGKYDILKLKLRNCSKTPIFLQEANVLDISGENGGLVDFDDLPVHWTIYGIPMDPFPAERVYDLCNQRWNFAKYDFYMADYAVIGNKKTDQYITLGFLSFARQHGVIRLKLEQDIYNFEYLRAICEFDGYQLDPGETVVTEPLYINLAARPREALDEYIRLVLKTTTARHTFPNIVGWGTWDYYHPKITEEELLKNVKWLAAHRNELPVEYIQLDHGFEILEGEWLRTNKKFPHGLKWLAAEIRRHGFKAGIWLCPFLVAKKSRVFREHPDWIIRDKSGQPITVFGYATPHVYILDCSLEPVQNWIRDLGRAVKEYGFDYVKLDGANVQPMAKAGVLANRKFTKAQAMRAGLEKFREGIGNDTVLLNACLFGLSIGIADAMRIGPDVGARWDTSKLDVHHGERDDYPGSGDIYHAIIATLNSSILHKQFWINDPDYLVARQRGSHSELSYEEAQSWVSIVGLSNGLIMLSDRMPELRPDRCNLLKKVLPPYERGAKPIGFFNREIPYVFDLEVENETDQWHVVGVINLELPKRERDYALVFNDLGLDRKKQYHVFDFWGKRYLGSFRERLLIEKLKPHQCRILCIREKKDIPQVLSTDTHITQGGVEIAATCFDPKEKLLTIKTRNINRSGSVCFYVPDGYKPKGKSARKVSKHIYQMAADMNGGNITVSFERR